MNNTTRALALAALAAPGIRAQTQDQANPEPCPRQVVDREPTEIRVPTLQKCGSDILIQIGGIRYRPPQNTCPLLVVITPAHDRTRPEPASYTYTLPQGSVAVVVYRYACVDSVLWGLFGSWCEFQSRDVMGHINCYAQYPCGR